MLEGRSLAAAAVVVAAEEEAEEEVVGNRWGHKMADRLASGEEEVVGNRWGHKMADRLASGEGEVAALQVVGSSSGRRLGRTFACMVEDRGVEVGVVQVVEEV